MSAYFITAVGTGIGKTFTTCALLAAARAQMRVARGYKPVLSGWMAGEDNDQTHIIAAGGHVQALQEVSPWRFAAALSPHRAAALEGRELVLEEIVAWSRLRAEEEGLILIEGVGGVMVPLSDRHTTLDWMRALGLPVILVTGSYLGSLSHTLTALEVLEHAGLQVKALVMNETAGSDVTFAEAQAGLMPFIESIPLRIFQPRVSSYHEAAEISALLNHL